MILSRRRSWAAHRTAVPPELTDFDAMSVRVGMSSPVMRVGRLTAAGVVLLVAAVAAAPNHLLDCGHSFLPANTCTKEECDLLLGSSDGNEVQMS